MAVKDEKLDVLRWHLGFINLEIGELSHGDRLKWITEALYIIEFGVPKQKLRRLERFDKAASHKKISEWDTGTKLEDCHALLKASVENMVGSIQQTINPRKSSAPKRKASQESIFATLETTATVRVQAIRSATKPIDDKCKLRTIIDAKTDEESLLTSFYLAMEGVQIGSLRVCGECGNYFLHTSKKEKKFCANKCAARKASRARRERIKKDPKKYAEELKKSAGRARKSYVGRIKNGKPARRPTKHKDSTEE